jgi:hypothetical protein
MAGPGSLQFVMQVLRQFTEKHVKIITLDATANLVEDTPRDTGWARSNWVPSIGKSVDHTVGTPESVSKSASESGVAAVASGYTLEKGPVFISNNVPYIGRLNDGSSKQAPSGFVQAAILRAVRGAFRAGGQSP